MKIKLCLLLLAVTMLLSGCIGKQNGYVSNNESYVEDTVAAPEATVYPAVKEQAPVQDDNLVSKLTNEERYELNIFLSNFSEAYYNPDGYYKGDEAKINFAFIHAAINNKTTFYEDGYMCISAENVDKALIRFFGSSIPHKTPDGSLQWIYKDGKFLMPAASGESYGNFSVATEMKKRNDGNLNVKFNIYWDNSVTGGDIITDKSVYYLTPEQAQEIHSYDGCGEAVIKEKVYNGKNTYELVSYSVTYNN